MTWLGIVFLIIAVLLTMAVFLTGLMIGFRLRHNLPPVEIPLHRPVTPPEPTPTERAAEDEEAREMVQLWAAANEIPESKINIMA